MIRTLLTAAIALSAFAATAPANAADSSSTVVRYLDLNLASTAGTMVLKQRINAAIDSVCGYADSRDLGAMQAVSHCRSVALAGTRSQVVMAIDGRSSVTQIASR